MDKEQIIEEIENQLNNQLLSGMSNCKFEDLQNELLSATVDNCTAMFNGQRLPEGTRFNSIDEFNQSGQRYLYFYSGKLKTGGTFDMILNVSIRPCAYQFIINTPPTILGVKDDIGIPVAITSPLVRRSVRGHLVKVASAFADWIAAYSDQP